MPEKCLERVPVHMPEFLKHRLQDLAMHDGRAVGEYIRQVLSLHVYGAGHRLDHQGASRPEGDRYGPR